MKPTAAFEWSMPSRATGWVKAWRKSTATYNPNYVSPKQWSVILDASASQGGGFEIANYHWEISGLDGIALSHVDDDTPATLVIKTPGQSAQSTKLAAKFSKTLKQLGRYRVTLTVTNTNGESSDPHAQVIHLQDLLIRLHWSTLWHRGKEIRMRTVMSSLKIRLPVLQGRLRRLSGQTYAATARINRGTHRQLLSWRVRIAP